MTEVNTTILESKTSGDATLMDADDSFCLEQKMAFRIKNFDVYL